MSVALDDMEKNNLESPEMIEELKQIGSTFYTGGADTSSAVLLNFLLAMVQNPAVFQEAQREVDEVVGQERLPGFDDRPRLPYLECLVHEVLRLTS
jgi:cytochrome P450